MCPCMVDTGRPASMSTWSPYRNNNMGSALQSPFGSQLMSLEMVACRGGLRSLYIRPDGIVLHGLSSHIGSVPSWKPRLSVFDPHRAVLTCPSFHKPPYDFSGDYPPPEKLYGGLCPWRKRISIKAKQCYRLLQRVPWSVRPQRWSDGCSAKANNCNWSLNENLTTCEIYRRWLDKHSFRLQSLHGIVLLTQKLLMSPDTLWVESK